MERERVTALHYITPVSNLESIKARGLLCHDLAARFQHVSVASEDVQNIRATKRVPTPLLLHEYVNLYFDARNSMMYTLVVNQCPPLVVLEVSPEVLDFPDAVIADGNAASGTTRFYRSPGGLNHLNDDLVFARSWNHPDYWEKAERKRIRSAEVLVPRKISVEYIKGFVARTVADAKIAAHFGWSGEVNADVFFE